MTKKEIDNSSERPRPLPVNVNGVPQELRDRIQWVGWSYESRQKDGKSKWTKIPLNPRTGQRASSTDASTWATFEEAFKSYSRNGWNGIGFVFTEDDPFCGIDIDDAFESESGSLKPWAAKIIQRLDTYSELSPSGTGIKLYLIGKKPGNKCRGAYEDGEVEIYDSRRFFAVTGSAVDGFLPASLNERQQQLDEIYTELFPDETQVDGTGHDPSVELSDEEIITRAFQAKNGDKFRRLWEGDTSDYSGDHSRADLGLCSNLAFWCQGDRSRIDALFRKSGLVRDKWDERHGVETYGQATIDKALDGKTEFYKSNGRHKHDSACPAVLYLRPRIFAGCEDLTIITPQAWKAIQAHNEPPRLFRYGGILSRIERDDAGAPIVKPLTNERVQYELARAADLYKMKGVGENQSEASCLPPKAVVQDILATPDPPLPVLTRIVEAPVFAPDGTLHDQPGYNPATLTYYEPAEGFELPPVPNNPTPEEIGEAVRFLKHELIGDYPFIGEAEKAHVIAAMLLPFVRDLIDGPTPLHLVEKPTQGTGATLLVQCLTYPALGRDIAAMTEGRDEDEWRKRVFAKLRSAPAAVLIDNLKRRLDSAALSSAITAFPQWEDRLLGVSEIHRVPNRCLWMATGNNPALSGEMTRRTIRIRLDPKIDRPWLRTGFRHEDLRSWVKENRSKLVWSSLVLIRAWFAAGKPPGKRTIGMFESWAKTMGGILETAGISGFLQNLDEFYETADAEGEAWRAFVATWWDRFGEREVGVSDLFQLAVDGAGLDLGDKGDRSQKSKLGKMLSAARDRAFAVDTPEGTRQIRIEHGGKVKRASQWRLRLLLGEHG